MGIVAYLDAGNTSMLVGAVAAGAAGVAVAAKVGWRRATGVFRSKNGVPAPEFEADSVPEEPLPDAHGVTSAPESLSPSSDTK